MTPPDQQVEKRVDHTAYAQKNLTHAVNQAQRVNGSDDPEALGQLRAAIAQVHATLAQVEQLERLNEALRPDESETVWLCAKCGYGSKEHGMEGHPAFECVSDMRLARAFRRRSAQPQQEDTPE